MTLTQLTTTRKTLGNKAYRSIRNEIISLHLKPGEMIYEKDIAALLGISRTPLREAFHMLMQEELIVIIPNRGAQVAYISEQKVIEAQVVRESLELCSFVKVAAVWNRESPIYQKAAVDILDIIEGQKKAMEEQDYMTFVQLDEDFHNRILELANNRTLLSIVNQMRAHLNRMRYLELQEAHHEKEAIRQHEMLFQAIQANDDVHTEKLLIAHLKLIEDARPAIINKYSDFFERGLLV